MFNIKPGGKRHKDQNLKSMGEDGNVCIFFYLQVFHVKKHRHYQRIQLHKEIIKTRLLEQYGNRQEMHQ